MASFKRLSPSRTVTILLGTRRPLIIEMAATASGGEIIAPSTRPKIQPAPGDHALKQKSHCNARHDNKAGRKLKDGAQVAFEVTV